LLLLFTSLPALVAGPELLLTLAVQRATTRAIRGGALAACLWVVGFVLAPWDPAEAWVWLFD
jgi:hypothetical protein